MSVEQQVDALTASVEDLKGAVISKKATLDASVADAQSATAQAQAAKANALSARDQAGSFKDAAYSAAQSAASAVAYQDLSAVALTKAVTAVHVFIYDTSKDSDGGAWRHRCAGTSWYREPLNTATRGARREFPAVAIIVVEVGVVRIYDADDPTMPMWMVFEGGYNNIVALGSGYFFTSACAKNGVLAVGHADGARAGLDVVNLITDAGKHYGTTEHPLNVAYGSSAYKGNIAQRNAALDNVYIGNIGLIANNTVNDVAMTVLPEAAVDPATRLPVPTIAVAVGRYGLPGGGVSIIDGPAGIGTVVDIPTHQSAAGGYECKTVEFGPHGELLMNAAYNGSNATVNVFETLPITDLPENNIHPTARSYGLTTPALTPGTSAAVLSAGEELFMADGRLAIPQRAMYWSHLALVHENKADKTKGMVAYIGHDFNTGWQVGDSRLAALCGTDDTDLTQENLVTNGTFADLSGWNTGDWVATGSAVTVDSALAYTSISQLSVFKPNAAYFVSFDYEVTAGGLAARAGSGGQFGFFDVNAPAAGSWSGLVRTIYNSDGMLMFTTKGGGITGSVTNVIVREVVADQGPKLQHLDVKGAIARAPVAAGSDLVGYGGFSSINYLEQPYTAHLDVGSGDLCITGWVNPVGDNQAIASYENATDGHGWAIGRSTGVLRLYTGRGGQNKAYSFGTLATGNWQFFCVFRKAGYWFGGINGAVVPDGIIGALDSFATGNVLRIGWQSLISGGAWSGAISMVRVSTTAPTAEQIRSIYDDEKALFKENEFCAAGVFEKSALKALAHDPDTGLLHIGGNGGRATFKGLRRVAKSTAPVATSIAAQNELVVQQ